MGVPVRGEGGVPPVIACVAVQVLDELVARRVGVDVLQARLQPVRRRELVLIVELEAGVGRVAPLVQRARVLQVEVIKRGEVVGTQGRERRRAQVAPVVQVQDGVALRVVVLLVLTARIGTRLSVVVLERRVVHGREVGAGLVGLVVREALAVVGRDRVVGAGVVVELEQAVGRRVQALERGVPREGVVEPDERAVVVQVAADVAVLEVGAPVVVAVAGPGGELGDAAPEVAAVLRHLVDEAARLAAVGRVRAAGVQVDVLQADRDDVGAERVGQEVGDVDAVHLEADLVDVRAADVGVAFGVGRDARRAEEEARELVQVERRGLGELFAPRRDPGPGGRVGRVHCLDHDVAGKIDGLRRQREVDRADQVLRHVGLGSGVLVGDERDLHPVAAGLHAGERVAPLRSGDGRAGRPAADGHEPDVGPRLRRVRLEVARRVFDRVALVVQLGVGDRPADGAGGGGLDDHRNDHHARGDRKRQRQQAQERAIPSSGRFPLVRHESPSYLASKKRQYLLRLGCAVPWPRRISVIVSADVSYGSDRPRVLTHRDLADEDMGRRCDRSRATRLLAMHR
uniref:Uncharacterized protein n=1 Tax=uncultured Armatimonadetes bacterium TaxID=157466 RepID=A0A6J4IGF6_9BACT|nr:hypothetical protein AVDCRST_MAG63-1856 [uncultured Armatimonadetes bacterium]